MKPIKTFHYEVYSRDEEVRSGREKRRERRKNSRKKKK
jgi:hypothetical protein